MAHAVQRKLLRPRAWARRPVLTAVQLALLRKARLARMPNGAWRWQGKLPGLRQLLQWSSRRSSEVLPTKLSAARWPQIFPARRLRQADVLHWERLIRFFHLARLVVFLR